MSDGVWIGPSFGPFDDDAPPMVRAYRLTTALAHAAGHKTDGDYGMEEADEIVAKMDRGEYVKTYTAEELIAELELERPAPDESHD